MEARVRGDLKKLGRTVREARRALGKSQEDFAEMADIHRNYAGAIERGEVNISWHILSGVARGLRVPVSELLRRAGL